MTIETFGQTADGADVHRVTIRGGGLTARLMDWGAAVQDLRLEGHAPPLVLGFDRFEDYPAHSPYFGATAGRYANRIAEGRFQLDGAYYQLDLNEKGRTHLHGGSQGIGKRIWDIAESGADFVRFELVDADGHMGYPGNCRMACTYQVKTGGVLSVVLEAQTDRSTICNLTHHSYFNLDGNASIDAHELMIAADHYLPVDGDLIPTGEITPVAGTAFDFTEMRPTMSDEYGQAGGYDHNFCLSGGRENKRAVALARSLNSGVGMEVWTSEPGLQFYTGAKIDIPVDGLDGRKYGAFAGFCLEAQLWPDSPNHSDFPDAILRPGGLLRQETDYIFSLS
ncbi:aldose epimerase family protein [Hoeflea prorocentri]|uniref:Aldose 1-epimerase n=1 Tax=Hoeflea prorocentri TaxID=1922333 RepID=A0A9X3ZJK5_9HYPH|nr:aldose epimerase family protein [Hoeflea prorocentri]MCY6383564.1 galactose mutarotase [Hoeflea prorocentri]MDA5401364.1 galactose mutarotase [Hoeflea prorocentri]